MKPSIGIYPIMLDIQTENFDTKVIRFGAEEEAIVDHLSLFMEGLLQYEDFVLSAKESSDLGPKITETGFAEYNNTEITDRKVNQLDSMESFWLAETLKCL
ncbi:hypothetical protein CONCODRAFT_2045 [Conidiobolus coronatus NRRL 28638]|uniref:Uncharacterized protein n=1 Tax=Conidiobolus coronatus (strain ATCC 28846 / CBS 209.66 / NRRL 28638) TaxID=796925 RepID=A0A137PIY4_CONC2|nr:hypothetical protein CONCODRAFT_2045 [Conidiobolus coronatus NRRL 28638]|eukprot:KXN74968.1 hypothetical protein CONCODRAFT_2045 [Conidiobolus coronatus NRRL 28638]